MGARRAVALLEELDNELSARASGSRAAWTATRWCGRRACSRSRGSARMAGNWRPDSAIPELVPARRRKTLHSGGPEGGAAGGCADGDASERRSDAPLSARRGLTALSRMTTSPTQKYSRVSRGNPETSHVPVHCRGRFLASLGHCMGSARRISIMASKKGPSLTQIMFGALSLGFVAFIGVFIYNYAKSGGGSKKNAVAIPDPIEDRIDVIVDTLNAQWPDKRWADRGLEVVASYLEGVLPPGVARLVDAIQEAETEGAKQNLSGPQKLALAVKLVSRTRGAASSSA